LKKIHEFIVKEREKFIIVVLLAVLSISFICIYVHNKRTEESISLRKVSAFVVSRPEKIYLDGVVEPNNVEYVSLDNSLGEVYSVNVSSGSTVNVGDLLFTYRNENITEQLSELKLKKKNLEEGINKLKEEMANASEEKLTSLESKISSAQGDLSILENKIATTSGKEYTQVCSKSNGVVYLSENPKSDGYYLKIQSSDYFVKCMVDEKNYNSISVDEQLTIEGTSLKESMNGKVIQKDFNKPESNTNENTNTNVLGASEYSGYLVKVQLDNQEGLLNGTHVQCILDRLKGNIKIKTDSIIDINGEKVVFVIKDGKLVKTPVTIIDEEYDETIVNSTLTGGERIVKNPTIDMVDGESVALK